MPLLSIPIRGPEVVNIHECLFLTPPQEARLRSLKTGFPRVGNGALWNDLSLIKETEFFRYFLRNAFIFNVLLGTFFALALTLVLNMKPQGKAIVLAIFLGYAGVNGLLAALAFRFIWRTEEIARLALEMDVENKKAREGARVNAANHYNVEGDDVDVDEMWLVKGRCENLNEWHLQFFDEYFRNNPKAWPEGLFWRVLKEKIRGERGGYGSTDV